MSQLIESRMGSWNARAARVALLVAGAFALLSLLPAAAEAKRPRIQGNLRIEGTAQVGQALRAEGVTWSGKDVTVSWQWLRCDSAGWDGDDEDDDEDFEEHLEEHCDRIDGARSTSYTAVSHDRGTFLRVLLVVSNRDGYAWRASAPTAKVADPPAPPPPPADPGPVDPGPSDPGPSDPGTAALAPAAPSPAPLTVPAPPPEPTGSVLPERAKKAVMMRPSPLVRIRGRLTRRGARITLFTIRAPRGARITLRCRGRSCPARRLARATKVTRLTGFHRNLRAGTKIVVTVTKRGRIGKHTTILIRRNRAPWRSDRCLYPGSKRPSRCPAATR